MGGLGGARIPAPFVSVPSPRPSPEGQCGIPVDVSWSSMSLDCDWSGDKGAEPSRLSATNRTSSWRPKEHLLSPVAKQRTQRPSTEDTCPHLGAIQHAPDHRGNALRRPAIVMGDALQHHPVGPPDQLSNGGVETGETGRDSLTVGTDRVRTGDRVETG